MMTRHDTFPATPATLTPVHRRFLDWVEAERAAAMAAPDLPESELKRLSDASINIANEIEAMPSESATDLALKLSAYTAFGAFDLPQMEDAPTLHAEAETLRRGGALPASPPPAPDAELLATYARWVALRSEWLRLCELDHQGRDPMEAPEVARVDAEANALFDHMLTLKPQTPQGFGVYCALIWEDMGPGWQRGTPRFEEAAASPEYAACLALWRHVGTGEPYPDQWRLTGKGGAA